MVTTCISSIQCSNIRFLLIFVDFDYENRYDREKVASTLTFWRHLAPEHKSGRNFFKITTTFTVQIAICWPCYRVLFRPDSPRHRPIFGGPRGRNPQIKTTISPTPTFGESSRRCELPFRPHLPAHIPRMTLVSSNSLKLQVCATFVIILSLLLVLSFLLLLSLS